MRGILTYHSVDNSGSPISIGEHSLRSHLKWLASREVQVVPLEWIHKVPAEKHAYPQGLDRTGLGLKRARVGVMYGLIFATWNENAPALEDHYGESDFYYKMFFGLLAVTTIVCIARWDAVYDAV